MKRNSRRAGISLVALVITIIVLIILTGAVIVTFMEGGIIDRAKESVFKNDMRTYQEILALKRAENQMEIALGEKEDVEINASTLEEIQAIIPEFKEEYEGLVVITKGELSIGERVSGEDLSSTEELYATWLDDLGIGLSRLPKNALAKVEGLEVGDYVKYSPGNRTYTIATEDLEWIFHSKNGWEDTIYNPGEEIIESQDINWRVLKNDGRQVTLISEMPIDNIMLKGIDGWVKGPEKIDEIYNYLYSSDKGRARGLKEEDVNEIMGYEPQYAYYYDKDGNEIEVPYGKKIEEIAEEEQVDITNWNIPVSGIDIGEYELSSYSYTGSEYKTEENTEAYKLIFKDEGGINDTYDYFLSSSYLEFSICSEGYIGFIIRGIRTGYLMGWPMLFSNEETGYDTEASVKPIVILNSDVEVSNPTAGGDTVDTAWKLK